MVNQAMVSRLIEQAAVARGMAYAPYSHFPVGAAVLARSGKIYLGCNVENSSYGLGVCAERVAIWKAISEGDAEFDALAVVTDIGGSPCGACRQVMAEFAPEMPVFIADTAGAYTTLTVEGLLPLAFGPQHLAESASRDR